MNFARQMKPAHVVVVDAVVVAVAVAVAVVVAADGEH